MIKRLRGEGVAIIYNIVLFYKDAVRRRRFQAQEDDDLGRP